MEKTKKSGFDLMVRACRLNSVSTTRKLKNILVLDVVLVAIAYFAFFSMKTVYARSIYVTLNGYDYLVADEKLNSYTATPLNKQLSEQELPDKEDFTIRTEYHTECNYYMYSGLFAANSTPARRTWAHAYELYNEGKIYGATAGRWCTFFAQMWFYDVFGFNSSDGAAGNGNTFAMTVYNSAVYYDEEGNLKHYFRISDHPETMSIVSIYSDIEEGHVVCIDEVDYDNNTITISEGNANGEGSVRIRQTMSLNEFYASNQGYKVYIAPTEELLKMISSKN